MKKIILLPALASIALSGCTTPAVQAQNAFARDLAEVTNVKQAADILGMPTGKRTLLGKDVYTWQSSRNSQAIKFGFNDFGNLRPESQIINVRCKVELITVENSLDVESRTYDGSVDGCQSYIRLLDNFYYSNHPAEDPRKDLATYTNDDFDPDFDW
ncbi:hypothetical protein VHA01S_027_00490 [Vibrio halioticoli NBRC 102217]|uniref:Lipoprotein SmpA/OmlA domain-containing protein n=1 Tax=Vibrio halioticoli NBRC 102217 TaxID=1219072 RepID=V5FLP4_9VIBR|nr:hypothetical protein [Vibrio halioticoli]GAD89792.1 hypothetical protein VHA01S_027_00490 [Vibrio halioticoli NBRC 102217]